jgi:hypothetical protein
MTSPLMPKATALWLIDNTSLSFEQIADFCGLHPLEIQSLADGEGPMLQGIDPINNGQVTRIEISRCEQDPQAKLKLTSSTVAIITSAQEEASKRKYTPEALRENKPNAIAWLIKNCPEMTDKQIAKLVGSTQPTVLSIKNKSHWNIANITPKDPVLLGICSRAQFEDTLEKARSLSGTKDEA